MYHHSGAFVIQCPHDPLRPHNSLPTLSASDSPENLSELPPLAVVTPGALRRSCTGALIQRSPLGGSQRLRPLSQSRNTLIRRSIEHGVFDAS
jgi:hypothetical protein